MSEPIVPDVRKTAKPTAAGILSIISGTGCVLGGLGIGLAAAVFGAFAGFYCLFPSILFSFTAIPVIALGTLSIIGGVFSLQRRRWGWVLAGSIAALLVSHVLGLMATVLTALSKDEFTD